MKQGTWLSPLLTIGVLAVLACEPAAEDTAGETDAQPAGVAAADPAAVREGIDQTNRAAEAAVAAGDVANFVQQTYTQDATILPPAGPVISGHEGITEFWTSAGQQLGLTSIRLATEEVVPLGPDAAYEIGIGTLETAQGPMQAKYVVVWQRGNDGRWRWHVDIWNDMPAE